MSHAIKMAKITSVVKFNAARALLKIFHQLGIKCGLHGDVACGVYGVSRALKAGAVEVMLFSPSSIFPHIETLKRTIVLKSTGPSHFFLAGPESSSPNLSYSDTSPPTVKSTCTVLLTPYYGNARLELLSNVNGFSAVVPLPFLLLQKLQTWVASKSFTKKGRPRSGAKVIQSLLGLLDSYQFEDVHFDHKLFELSKERVREYRSLFPGHEDTWKRLGYDSNSAPPTLAPPPGSPISSSTSTETRADITPTVGTPTDLSYLGPNRIQMVCLAGKMTIDIIKDLHCQGAIFGSLACFLYGNQRSPNDVDVLVLPPEGYTVATEVLKSAIVELDPIHFFLIPARDPHAGYRILYFRLNDSPGGLTPRTSCKIDIVAPHNMLLPSLPTDLVNWDEGLPLIPFPLLLLQKLQSWDDHRKSADALKRLKQATDVEDLRGLFRLSEIKTLHHFPRWSDRRMFSFDFEALSRERVQQYCTIFPNSAHEWRSLGFET